MINNETKLNHLHVVPDIALVVHKQFVILKDKELSKLIIKR